MVYVKRWDIINYLNNYNYIVFNTFTKSSLIIDPTYSYYYIQFIKNHSFKPEGILLTHEHEDHINAALYLKKQYNVSIYASFNTIKEHTIDCIVHDHDLLNFKTTKIKVIFTPGHTNYHVNFYCLYNKILFTGDTIFNAGIGNTKDITGNIDDLYKSTIKIINLFTDDTKIYSGHDYFEKNLLFAISIKKNHIFEQWYNKIKNISSLHKPITTLHDEKQMNIFLLIQNTDFFKTIEKKLKVNSKKAAFVKLRKIKNNF